MEDALWQLRREVRRGLADVEPGRSLVVGLSGGPDSLALAAATAAEAHDPAWRVTGVVVDHGLQDGSGATADAAAAHGLAVGLDQVEVVPVDVVADGAGPEAAARAARYAALSAAASRLGSVAVLLGHTLDDQAETVLLGLARGSGARSLAGMSPRRGLFRRPLLGVRRTVTHQVCTTLGITPWQDPHNHDPSFTRVRVRHGALPALQAALGDRVVESLARTADRLREDDDALAQWASEALDQALAQPLRQPLNEAPCEAERLGLDVERLAGLPAAVRRRVLRLAALRADVPSGSLTTGHLLAVDALVVDWHGQGAVSLPGGVSAVRRCGRLSLAGDVARGQSQPTPTHDGP